MIANQSSTCCFWRARCRDLCPLALGLEVEMEPPSTTTWRRQRLTRIGSNSTLQAPSPRAPSPGRPEESTTLQPENGRSYGTLPTRPSRRKVPPISLPRSELSSPASLSARVARSPSLSVFRDLAYSRLSTQRPISAYDTPAHENASDDTEIDARINGVRVWYAFVSAKRHLNQMSCSGTLPFLQSTGCTTQSRMPRAFPDYGSARLCAPVSASSSTKPWGGLLSP